MSPSLALHFFLFFAPYIFFTRLPRRLTPPYRRTFVSNALLPGHGNGEMPRVCRRGGGGGAEDAEGSECSAHCIADVSLPLPPLLDETERRKGS